MLQNYFRIAWRNIVRNKTFTIINVSGLTLGVCACIVIFLVSHYEFSFDNFHPDKERIYHLGCKEPSTTWNTSRVPPPTPAALQQEIAGIEAVAAFYPYWPTVTIPDKEDRAHHFQTKTEGSDQSAVILTDPGYFTVFKYDWLAGSPGASLLDPFKVVLSETKAHKYFGDLPYNKIIGKEMIYDDSLSVTVAGIVKDWNKNTDFPFTEFISSSTINASFLKNTYHTDRWRPRGPWVWSMIKLSKNVTPAQITAQLEAFTKRHLPAAPDKKLQFLLQPLSDLHFNTDYSHDELRKAYLPTLYVLMSIALFILVLALINFINLSTAQSIRRAKEIGIRKVLGSSRSNLMFQFLTETFMVSAVAVMLAILLVRPVLSFFRDFIPPGLAFHPFDTATLAFILLLILLTSLSAGLYPAKVLSSYKPALSLKGESGASGSEKWWLRKGLIVFQFSIALIFIISTLVIHRQTRYMLKTDFGFKTDAVLAINTSWRDDISKLQVFEEKIKQLPGVKNLVLQGNAPTGWGKSGGEITFLGKKQLKLNVDCDWGNEAFIPFYGMKIVAGRNLLHSDSLQEFIINETYMRALGFSNPNEVLGQFLQFEKRSVPIVGVVADFHENSFHEPIEPLVIGHSPDFERSLGIQLAAKEEQGASVKNTLEEMGKIWKEIYPSREFEYIFIDEAIASFYDTERKTSKLMQAAMLITIFISCLGLFGLAIFTAQRKTKEIGIRKIIGASVTDIVTLLTKDFVLLVCVAFLIASPIAWFCMNRWLQGFAYRLPISGWIFAVAGAVGISIALLTVMVQSVRAALANPVKSLRSD